jgi:hypothetical protein
MAWLKRRIQISSETRVGLNEEIDRFIKKNRPKTAHYADHDPPWFAHGEWHILLDCKK